MKTQLEELTEAIVKAVPERWDMDIPDDCQSPITLEDVLRAAEHYYEHGSEEQREQMDEAMGTVGLYMLGDIRMEIVNDWTLGKPLSDQPPEVIAFLHSLLVR